MTNYILKAFSNLPNNCTKCHTHNCLEVHHRDGNRNNNALSNLQILCVDHHDEINGVRKRRKERHQRGSGGKYAKGTRRVKRK